MSGIGDVMLEHLTKVARATSKELADLVPSKPFGTAYSRLRVLADERRVVVVAEAERREDVTWTLEGALPFEPYVRVKKHVPPPPPKPPPAAPKDGHGFGRSLAWKPDLSRFEPLDGPLAKGDKLLVEYPERWRDTALCSVTKPSGYFGNEGHAQAWDLRAHCYMALDAAGWRERGWRVVRVRTEKELEKLASES